MRIFLISVVLCGFSALAMATAPQDPPPAQSQPPRQPPPPKPGIKNASLRIPAELLKPDAVFEIGGTPDWMAIDEHVWISNHPKDFITRIDPKTNKLIEHVTTGGPCSGLAAGFGTLWAPNCRDKKLERIDLKTGKPTASLPLAAPSSEGGVAVGAGSFWMLIDDKGTLARVDPATNKVVAEIRVAPGSFAVAFMDNAVWATSTEKSVVTKVNAQSNVVEETIPVGPRPRFLATGEGSVWTLNQGDGTITRIDGKSNKVVATIEAGIPGGGGEIAVGEGSVWVTVFQYPLTRIDPKTNKVAQQFYGPGGDSVRVGHGSVWLADLRAGKILRLDPKRIEATSAEK